MQRMSRLALELALVTGCAWPLCLADLPEPDVVFHGQVLRSGVPVTNGAIVARYAGKETPGVFTLDGARAVYVIRVPVDRSVPGSPPGRPSAAHVGDEVSFFLDKEPCATSPDAVVIERSGVFRQLDLSLTGPAIQSVTPSSLFRGQRRKVTVVAAATSLSADTVLRLVPEDIVVHSTTVLSSIGLQADVEVSLSAALVPHDIVLTQGESSLVGKGLLRVLERSADFRRGDSNGDGMLNIADAVYVLRYLFQGGPSARCEAAMDADDDDTVTITDAISVLVYLFQGGLEPRPPGPLLCGPDPTMGETVCLSYACP